MSEIDLGQIFAATQAQMENVDNSLVPAVLDTYSKWQDLNNSKITQVLQAGEADSRIKMQEELGKLDAQNNTLKAATMLGTNLQDAAELISPLSSQIRENYLKANEALDRIHKKESVGFLDDPLGFISNAVTLDQDYADYNHAAEKFNIASNTYAQINNLTQESAVTQNALAQLRTQASAKETAELVKRQAELKATELSQQGLLTNLSGIKAVYELNKDQLEMYKSNYQLEATAEQRQWARAQAEAMLEERIAAREARKASKEDDASTVSYVNSTRRALGIGELGATDVLKLMRMPGTLGDQVRSQFTAGAANASLPSSSFSIASTPAEAAKLTLEAKAPLNPLQAPVKGLVESVYIDAKLGKIKEVKDVKDENHVLQVTNKVIAGKVAAMKSNVLEGGSSNIYSPPALEELATTSVKDTKFYKVLAPSGSFNPEALLTQGLAKVKAGELKVEDVISGISAYANAAKDVNNETKAYSSFGLPKQESFLTRVDDGSAFFGMMDIDLSNEVKVSNWVTKRLYKVKQAEAARRANTPSEAARRFEESSRSTQSSILGIK